MYAPDTIGNHRGNCNVDDWQTQIFSCLMELKKKMQSKYLLRIVDYWLVLKRFNICLFCTCSSIEEKIENLWISNRWILFLLHRSWSTACSSISSHTLCLCLIYPPEHICEVFSRSYQLDTHLLRPRRTAARRNTRAWSISGIQMMMS